MIPLLKPDLPPLEACLAELTRSWQSGRVTNFGPFGLALEEEATLWTGRDTAAVSSGTTGLILTLSALGIGPGDLVAIPSLTFAATAQAVCAVGARPIFVDVGQDLTMAPEDLARCAETHPLAAVMPVHLRGVPCRVDHLLHVLIDLHLETRLPIIYDAAHALGAEWLHRRVGQFGAAEVFSLSATKPIAGIEGGLVCGDPPLIATVRRMRNYGMASGSGEATGTGQNGKLSEWHAIPALWSLQHIEQIRNRRAAAAERYCRAITTRTRFWIPPRADWSIVTSMYKDIVVGLPEGIHWDTLHRVAAERAIDIRRYLYPPLHHHSAFARWADRPLPVTERLAPQLVQLPFWPSMEEDTMTAVVELLATIAPPVPGDP